ncbi:unnamed protein product [Auanema sp. JU1783]|nr:unnamed protein product [Auanema sp. JU1783]
MWKDPMRNQNPYTMSQHEINKQEDDFFPETPEVHVQFRKRTPAAQNNLTNRHSYHGGSTVPEMYFHDHRYSQAQVIAEIPHRNSLFIPRTQDDREQGRCNRQRHSGSFGLSLAVLPENTMSSNDPLLNKKQVVDTLQQGADILDSPRDGSVVSGSSTKRDDPSKPQHSMVPPGGIPLQGQVLVDPNTGQHYLIPQTAFYQPLQPMYYPPPQATPMYYPYNQGLPNQQGFVMPPSSQNGFPLNMQHNSYGNASQRPMTGSSPYRQGYNHAFSSQDDVSSRRDMDERRFDEHPPQSPTLSTTQGKQMFYGSPYQPQVTSFAQHYRQKPSAYAASNVSAGPSSQNARTSPNSQPEDPDCSRDSFRRDVTRSSAEFTPRSSGEYVRHGSGTFQGTPDQFRGLSERTPLYGGPPQWWGRNNEEESLTDVESKRPITRSPPAQSSASDTEAMRPSAMLHSPRPPTAAKPVRMDFDFKKSAEEPKREKPPTRSVRLDFDLSKPLPEEDELQDKKKAVPRAPGTAFTVTFDSPGEVSLQDAARRSAQARRALGRRTGVVQAGTARIEPEVSTPQNSAGSTTNKAYLLNKLLNGGSPGKDSNIETHEILDHQDCDAVSEAGTFVIDSSKRPSAAQRVMPSRIIENSDDDSTDSDSGSSRTASPPRTTIKSTPALTNNDEMLRELSRLRQTAIVKPSTAPVPAVPRTRFPDAPRPFSQSNATPLAKRTSLGSSQSGSTVGSSNRSVYGQAHTRVTPSSASTTVTSNAFRRGDGGRFSMRGALSSGGSSPQAAQKQQRPPFRAGAAPMRNTGGNLVQQREQEMNAWLRRKDYNPMKAAAEAKKQREQQSRGDQFVSSRSISFHVGPTPVKTRLPDYGDLTRNRSQESLAVEDAEHASQQIVAEYSRGVVKNLNRLSQQSSRATGKQVDGLTRAVDMLSQKCKKSIELIRSQNKGCLSVSVEDLLAAAAEPPRDDESVHEQLDRLSNAFDAVQRYLEQYSLDGHESPIPEFSEEPETNSVVSGFSGYTFKSHQLRTPSEVASPIDQVGDCKSSYR